jgi:hypothetical protein
MKKMTIKLFAVTVTFAIMFQAKAGFGDFASGALGGAIGGLTAESLNKDLNSGLDFFKQANIHYANAVLPAEDAGKIAAELSKESKDLKDTQAAQHDAQGKIKARMDEMIAKHEALSDDAKKEIDLGQKEMSKGIAKWTTIGVSLGVAASQKNGQDAALVAAIPVATELIKDISDLKKMSETVSNLKKIQHADKKAADEAQKK